jgi:cell fate regulator YaaT (PSP1 superfamily)
MEAQLAREASMFDAPEWTQTPDPPTPVDPSQPRLVGVRFQRAGKIYHYDAQGFDGLKVGDWVIVDTARGKQMGQVATLKPPKAQGGPYKRIERRATGRDMAMRHYYASKELEALIACRAESAALNLPIKIVRAEYSFDGQTLTFLYSTDEEERVEVAALREAMSRLYRARIETRQVSPREVAKILGGIGACGIEERCCSRFLTEFSPISIKHAKEQNLSLNPQDITGMCGRLRCCLIYEYEQYVEARRHLPKLKSMVGTPLGPGKVVEILHLRDSVRVKIGEGAEAREVEFHREQLTPLEALRRLQEKALSGSCDRHENGACDCGKGKPAAGEHATAPQAAHAEQSETPTAGSGRAKKRRRRRAKKTPTDLARHAKKGGSNAKQKPSNS